MPCTCADLALSGPPVKTSGDGDDDKILIFGTENALKDVALDLGKRHTLCLHDKIQNRLAGYTKFILCALHVSNNTLKHAYGVCMDVR